MGFMVALSRSPLAMSSSCLTRWSAFMPAKAGPAGRTVAGPFGAVAGDAGSCAVVIAFLSKLLAEIAACGYGRRQRDEQQPWPGTEPIVILHALTLHGVRLARWLTGYSVNITFANVARVRGRSRLPPNTTSRRSGARLPPLPPENGASIVTSAD